MVIIFHWDKLARDGCKYMQLQHPPVRHPTNLTLTHRSRLHNQVCPQNLENLQDKYSWLRRCSVRSTWSSLLPPLRSALRIPKSSHSTRYPCCIERQTGQCCIKTISSLSILTDHRRHSIPLPIHHLNLSNHRPDNYKITNHIFRRCSPRRPVRLDHFSEGWLTGLDRKVAFRVTKAQFQAGHITLGQQLCDWKRSARSNRQRANIPDQPQIRRRIYRPSKQRRRLFPKPKSAAALSLQVNISEASNTLHHVLATGHTLHP